MNSIVVVQEISIAILEIALRLAYHEEHSWNTICDEFKVTYKNNRIHIEFSVEGIALLDLEIRSQENSITAKVSKDYFGGISRDFPSDYFEKLVEAFEDAEINNMVLDTKLKRYSRSRGAMEVRFERYGAVYMEYSVASDNAVTVTRCGAMENKDVRLRTIL